MKTTRFYNYIKCLLTKQALLLILSIQFSGAMFSQGITLVYRGHAGWDDQNSWIQLDAPPGQQPISRVPTEFDDVVLSRSISGDTILYFWHNVVIGGGAGSLCRSIHVSNMELDFEELNTADMAGSVDVYTDKGGFVLADSGANIRHGIFTLHGGDASITDLQIINSRYGDLFTHAIWSGLTLTGRAKARFIKSRLEGWHFVNNKEAQLYADSSSFITPEFRTEDNSTDTIYNSIINTGNNFVTLIFSIGRNAHFTSANNKLSSFNDLTFITSGAVFNGNINLEAPGRMILGQQDEANPLPNIINGNIFLGESYAISIKGDLKISGNLILNLAVRETVYPDTSTVFVNGQPAFVTGGQSYLNNNHCRLEFFGNTDSDVAWPLAFPVDTLIVNKSDCATVTFRNELYVVGATRIQKGRLALDPNTSSAYKFVCLGDLEIMEGGGLFLRKNDAGLVAGMAIQGSLYDYNSIADTACLGINNPYPGNITLYRNNVNDGNRIISIKSATGIGNLRLIGRQGSGFSLGNDLTVRDFISVDAGEFNLNNYKLTVKKSTE